MINYLQLYERMHDNKIMLTFKGEVTYELVNSILKIIENRLDKTEDNLKTRKKVYNVLVESLQNLCKHVEDTSFDGLFPAKTALLIIETDMQAYRLVTGNYVLNDRVDPLKERLDKINSSSKEELRELYKSVLDSGELNEKGGAGLGFIDIARKTGQKLKYLFQPVNTELSFFSLQIEIPKEVTI